MNRKFRILCVGLLFLPSCTFLNFRKHKNIISLQQECLPRKAYLCVNDIECEDCFKLIQGILSPIKGIQDISLEKEEFDSETAGSPVNRVIITYDSASRLNQTLIRMVLEEWTFELKNIEL